MDIKSRMLSTTDGRDLCISEGGQPDGTPVIVQHGTPSSRLLFHTWIKDAQSRDIRLISYDRPGYGCSTNQPGRNVASAAEDVATIANVLNLDKLSVWGISGGGPHALACAALLPNLIASAVTIGSPAPYEAEGLDWFAGMGDSNIEEFNKALDGLDALTEYLVGEVPGLLNAEPQMLVQVFQSLLSPIDASVFSEEIAEFMIKDISEGITDGINGWVDDDIALVSDWGFELSQIQVPVLIMHGKLDRFVPFLHGQWLVTNINNVESRLSSEDGHFTFAFSGISEIHSWILESQSGNL